MNNNILTSYEDDNKRITVHYDMCADAPNRKEEFLGKMLYTYDSGHLVDHIILSPDGDYFSFNENGMI